MTVIAAVLSPEYAAVLSDTRSTLGGPMEFSLVGQPARVYFGTTVTTVWKTPWVLAAGEQVTIDGLIGGLEKVKFLPGASEAVAYAGTRPVGGAYLGLDKPLLGLDADRAIAEHFAGLAQLERVADVPTGSHRTHDALHVFHANGRFIAAVFGASPFHLTRRYIRSFPADHAGPTELFHAAIGSGAQHLDRFLSENAEWQRLRSVTSVKHMDDVIHTFGAVLAKTCEHEADVNNIISCWVRTAGQPTFVHHSAVAHPATPLPPTSAAHSAG